MYIQYNGVACQQKVPLTQGYKAEKAEQMTNELFTSDGKFGRFAQLRGHWGADLACRSNRPTRAASPHFQGRTVSTSRLARAGRIDQCVRLFADRCIAT